MNYSFISPAKDPANILQWMGIGDTEPTSTQFYLNMGCIEDLGVVHMDPKGVVALNLLISASKLWLFFPEKTCVELAKLRNFKGITNITELITKRALFESTLFGNDLIKILKRYKGLPITIKLLEQNEGDLVVVLPALCHAVKPVEPFFGLHLRASSTRA